MLTHSAGYGRMEKLANLLGRIHEDLPQTAATLYRQSFVTAEIFVEADERQLQLWGFTAPQAASIRIACQNLRPGKENPGSAVTSLGPKALCRDDCAASASISQASYA